MHGMKSSWIFLLGLGGLRLPRREARFGLLVYCITKHPSIAKQGAPRKEPVILELESSSMAPFERGTQVQLVTCQVPPCRGFQQHLSASCGRENEALLEAREGNPRHRQCSERSLWQLAILSPIININRLCRRAATLLNQSMRFQNLVTLSEPLTGRPGVCCVHKAAL